MRFCWIVAGVLLSLTACGGARGASTQVPPSASTSPPAPSSAPAGAQPESDATALGGLRDAPAAESDAQGARLSRGAIRSVIASAGPAMRRCYESTVLQGPEPRAEGRVLASFIIGPDGHVQSAAIGEAAGVTDPALHECMLAVIRGLRFPPSGRDTGVNFPWLFRVDP